MCLRESFLGLLHITTIIKNKRDYKKKRNHNSSEWEIEHYCQANDDKHRRNAREPRGLQTFWLSFLVRSASSPNWFLWLFREEGCAQGKERENQDIIAISNGLRLHSCHTDRFKNLFSISYCIPSSWLLRRTQTTKRNGTDLYQYRNGYGFEKKNGIV
jgi:hypothetical protein